MWVTPRTSPKRVSHVTSCQDQLFYTSMSKWVMSHLDMIEMSLVTYLGNDLLYKVWLRRGGNEACRIYEWAMSHGNWSRHILMRHVTWEWVMSHMNESCHIWTSPVTYAYVVPHMNESHPVTRLIHMCHDVSLKLKVSFFKRATNCRALTISHMWISRVTHIMNESSHVWVSYSNRNESCLIYLQVTNMTHVYDLQIYVTWLVPPGHDWSISDMTHFCFTWPACMTARLITGRRRCHKLKVPFRKRATNCRALLWKETFKDNRYDSRVWPADIYRSYGGVSLVSRIDKIIFLFCNRAL